MPVYEYSLGTNAGNVTNLEEMSPAVMAPRHSRIGYTRPTPLGDMNIVALGSLKCTWHWDFLPLDQYLQLKTYCSGLSASVYMVTKDFDEEFEHYTAIMYWPTTEPEIENGKVLDVNIEFKKLTVYTP